jgi:hypothetical protein
LSEHGMNDNDMIHATWAASFPGSEG